MIDLAKVTSRLISDEGEVLHAYQDHLEFWTLGVGRLIDKRKGGGITQDESRYLLRNDINKRLAQCEARFDWWSTLSDERQGVVLCMAFQMGVDGVAGFPGVIRAIKARDYIRAAAEMVDSDWHKQTSARCERLAKIMRTGVWP